jgi:AcrR family transcriptional regulator
MAAQAADSATTRSAVSPAAVRDTALTLFAARGYHGTALSEIAQELGIRTPSLYNHMRAKQDLLHNIVVETSRQVLADYAAAVEGVDDVTERLRRAVETYGLRHAYYRREALIVNRDVGSLVQPGREEVLDLRRRHERAIRGLITEGVELGIFHVESPAVASFGILEMCVSIARWFREDGPLSAEEVARQYGEFALRIAGFTAESGKDGGSGGRSPDHTAH